MAELRVMTWNIASNRARFAAEAIAHGIDELDPDVVAMQEVCKAALKDIAKVLKRRTQWPHRGAGQGKVWHEHAGLHRAPCGPFGNAVLARVPLGPAQIDRLPPCQECRDHGEQRSVLRADAAAGDAQLRVYSTHHSPGAWTRGAGQLESALAFVGADRQRGTGQVVCGDFNERPERLRRFYDRLAEADPEGRPTYPAGQPTAKIDYVFLGGGATARDPQIPATFASDHRPLLVTVALP